MPEGDSVYLAAKRMHQGLAGHRLTRTDFRVPQLATTNLAGRAVLSVVPRGKHMLTRIEGGLTLHTHFKMDGTWHLYRPRQRWNGPLWQVRVVLETAERVAVGFRLPVVELVPTASEADVVGHLGPDLLGPGLGPRGGPAPPPQPAGARDRDRAARPAEPRRAGQPVAVRGAVPPRRLPLDPGRRGRGPARVSWTSATGCCRRTRTGRRRPAPARPAGARRPTSSAATASPAAAAAPRSPSASRACRRSSARPTGARTARPDPAGRRRPAQPSSERRPAGAEGQPCDG